MANPEIRPDRLPRHVAIIMDGNGRWAERRNLGRAEGHRAGVEAVRATTRAARELGVAWLSLYAFSSENWKRPREEVELLMRLPEEYFATELEEAIRNDVRIRTIGRAERLPHHVRRTMADAVEKTRHNCGMQLVFALSYGSRAELVDAARRLLREHEHGRIAPEALDEKSFAAHLDDPELPDVDLLIRTGGEARISNFLLWQIAYAELHFTDLMWPDFRREHLEAAILDYQHRERRYGRTSAQVQQGGEVPPMIRLSLLGSTGSIGEQTLAVAAAFPERFRVVALGAGRNVEKLAEQVRRFRPERVAVAEPAGAAELRERLAGDAPPIEVGEPGLEAVATHPADRVVAGLVGAVGLRPTLAAIRAGRDVALANKEVLVMAGALVTREVRRVGVQLLPVDSEHSAVFQVLSGQRREDVTRVVLTASGGPFLRWPAERIARATPAQALAHPNWDMGPKISIDSATLMNKGLELIEARWLFDLAAQQLDVVVHPQSIVHSLVELVDGSVLAQLGLPDMRVPIALALAHPERLPLGLPRLDLAALGSLDFEAPDRQRFPALGLAWAALDGGEAAPAVLNAANEVAVAAFLDGALAFPDIAATDAAVLDAFLARGGRAVVRDLQDVLEADAWGRAAARERVPATVRATA